METRRIAIEDIYVGDRLRRASPERVAALAQSIKDIGLMTPISVRDVAGPIKIDGEDVWEVPVLVAGLHRLEAAKSMGWSEINCLIVPESDIDAQLWEISENLHRAELTVVERSEMTTKYAELLVTKSRQVAAISPVGRGNKGGVRQAARDLGVDEKDIRRAKQIAALAPEAKEAARNVGLDDNQSALLIAAKAPVQQQAAIIRQYADEKRIKEAQRADKGARLSAAEELAMMIQELPDPERFIALLATVTPADVARAYQRLAA